MFEAMRGALASGKRQTYALAGKAIVTLTSPVTGNRFTYEISKSSGDAPVYFVALLSGPDNTSDFFYLGTYFPSLATSQQGPFRLTRKSRATSEALSVKAFSYFASHFESDKLIVHHEGTCGRCGRRLTVPESIERGIGPDCATKM